MTKITLADYEIAKIVLGKRVKQVTALVDMLEECLDVWTSAHHPDAETAQLTIEKARRLLAKTKEK